MATEEQIAVLDTRIEELEDEVAELRSQVLKAHVEQWRGRIEDLEVQVHLGSMEVAERTAPLVQTLQDRWLDAQARMSDSPQTASAVFDALRSGLEQAMSDVRSAVIDASHAAVR